MERGANAYFFIKKVGRHGFRFKGELLVLDSSIIDLCLTNRFDLATSTICKLYKARWRAELFFKAMKQNLRIKKFLGTSAHAVKAQIWVALIAYILVQMIRCGTRSSISIPDAMAV